MNKMRKNDFIFYSLLLGVFVISLLLYYFTSILPEKSKDYEGCDELKRVKYEQFTGVVSAKYIDSSNHCFKTAHINLSGNRTYTKIFVDQYGNIFNLFNVGDVIIKKRGQLQYYIKRKGTAKTLIEAKFANDCRIESF